MKGSPASSEPRKRVVVAMSGGVDSAVTAALMKEAGYDVVGITLQLYDHGAAAARKGSCCAGQDVHDARRVADALGIPHYVLDYERRFAETVIDSFAASYAAGETPIPCVTCNSQIKFKDLLETAKDLGADLMATGHYVQRLETPSGPALARAADAQRDQSYFLYSTTREQLSRLIFPLGGMTKPEVREIARRHDLPVAGKSDSQDICFVPTGRYADVIQRLKPSAFMAGEIVHVDGRRLGQHDGIANFTVGQRKGLKVPGPEALYVVRIDAGKNQVVVGPRQALRTTGLQLRDVNWIGDGDIADACRDGLDVYVRVRSSQPPRPARVYAEADGVRVFLTEGEDGVAAGQACVFYADAGGTARVLGGGTIARAFKAADGPGKPANNGPAPVRPAETVVT